MAAQLKAGIVTHLGDVLTAYKNVVVSGEEGVGKLRYTLAALKSEKHLYYIGNPYDYEGKTRAQGYDEYVRQVRSLNTDMQMVLTESDILSLTLPTVSDGGIVIVIDEMYGRCPTQCEKLLGILLNDAVRVVAITGCLRNVGMIYESLDRGVLLTATGLLEIERSFLRKMCSLLQPEPL
jgi:hypothetical protein